ncbi:MAG: uracil-DNA glycosylase [Gemmatimonadales bacterium]
MADERALYLQQQAELGGREVVVSERARLPVEAPRPVDRPLVPTAPQSSPAGPGSADWRKGAPPIPGPGLSVVPALAALGDDRSELATLDAVAAMVRECRRCPLCEGRTHAVPGDGDPAARLVVVGEGPGQTEDQTGRPFVGRAGDLLDKILLSIQVPRASAYVLNIVKCRPPQNRAPSPDEIAACMPYLHRQLALLRPKVFIAAGMTAAAGLLQSRKSLGQLRGQVHRYGDVPLVVTYHPAALLRNPHWKKPTWDDVRIARQLLDA